MPPRTETVTVLSSVNVLPVENAAVTVTVVPEAPSPTLDGLTDRFTAGGPSSSASVNAAPFTVRSPAAPATSRVSLPSNAVSWSGVSVNVPVPLVAPFFMVTSKSDTVS